MKILKISLLLSLILVLQNVAAQELDIEWGEEFDSATEVQKILGETDGKMVAYSIKGKKRFIETYDPVAGFRQTGSAPFELPEIGGKKSSMLNIALTGDHVTALLYVYKKKTKSIALYSYAVETDGRKRGDPIEVYKSAENDERINDRKVDVRFSYDNSKVLVFFDRINKKRTVLSSDIVVFDLKNELTKLSSTSHDFTLSSAEGGRADVKVYHSVEVDGSYHTINEIIEYKRQGGVEAFKLMIFAYDQNGNETGSVALQEGNKVLLSPALIVKDDGIFVVGYLMDNRNSLSSVKGYTGIFCAELGHDLSLKSLKTNSFSDEFMENIFSKKKIERYHKQDRTLRVPHYYTMDEIIVHADGSYTVLSEYLRVVVTRTSSGQVTQTLYGPILFFKLNAEGELVSSDAIKKAQMSSTKPTGIGGNFGVIGFVISVEPPDKLLKFWSYASVVGEDGTIYLVFNDHLKNSNDDIDDLSKPLKHPRRSVPYLVAIKPDGTFEKKAMISSADSETYAVPQVVYQISASELYIWGVWRKQNKFGLATIKK